MNGIKIQKLMVLVLAMLSFVFYTSPARANLCSNNPDDQFFRIEVEKDVNHNYFFYFCGRKCEPLNPNFEDPVTRSELEFELEFVQQKLDEMLIMHGGATALGVAATGGGALLKAPTVTSLGWYTAAVAAGSAYFKYKKLDARVTLLKAILNESNPTGCTPVDFATEVMQKQLSEWLEEVKTRKAIVMNDSISAKNFKKSKKNKTK